MVTVLGIDAATTGCSAALWRDGSVRAARFEEMERGQAERLNPMIGEVMAEGGIGFDALDRVAVTTGPGAFTGLRIGLAVARALGLALSLPVAGITTFEALAAAVPDDELAGRRLVVAVNGKRRDVFVQEFDGARRAVGAPATWLPAEAPRRLAGGAFLVAGDGAGLLRQGCAGIADAGDGAGARIRFSTATRPPDAAHVAALGATRPPASGPAPRPLYIRPPDVTLPAPGAGRGRR